MTIDGFDAAILIETAGFMPTAGELRIPEYGGPTLDMALTQAGLAERSIKPNMDALFDRHDATAPDLWLGRGSDSGDIGVTPLRPLKPDEMLLIAGGSGSDVTVWGPPPNPGGGIGGPDLGGGGWGGGGGGGQGGPENPYEFTLTDDDANCPRGAALKIGNHLHNNLENTVGKYEFGAILVNNGNGTYGALDNGIHTDFSPTSVRLTPDPATTDYSQIVGIVQNQPWHPTDMISNWLNRYPSGGDWAALETLANLGTNPANLSIFITDPWGMTREFKFSDRAFYQAMNDSQRIAGGTLPPLTTPCG